ncbi:hypothetical protein CG51_09225 [Haematobacter missouriensis]|uniref:Uncharacterized protein n=1 Tax=Haematobacter missouriensis TaxID=366616 RepID=A0A212AVM5_9RHOB|nr:hypothetical protein CG51_09225 [Haematobacter missouriensis]OWJ79270.1 hypothetical protein CDV53_01810 [Haematobacter missouriensis]OWJ85542.1 hypothetical protein CDV52_04030 [Haematobacter missouriensis]
MTMLILYGSSRLRAQELRLAASLRQAIFPPSVTSNYRKKCIDPVRALAPVGSVRSILHPLTAMPTLAPLRRLLCGTASGSLPALQAVSMERGQIYVRGMSRGKRPLGLEREKLFQRSSFSSDVE